MKLSPGSYYSMKESFKTKSNKTILTVLVEAFLTAHIHMERM